jgi:hypothetical protein
MAFSEKLETAIRAPGCNRAVKQDGPKNGERENSAFVSGSRGHFRTQKAVMYMKKQAFWRMENLEGNVGRSVTF